MKNFLRFCVVFLCAFLSSAYCKSPPIHVFIHVCNVGHWEEILEEELARIKTSGLYDACQSINLGVLGNADMHSFKKKYPKISFLFQSSDMTFFERPTLLRLYDQCRHQPHALVLYLHTKGVTRGGDVNVRDWTRLLEYFNIDKWRDCVTALTQGNHQVCGVNWQGDPQPHFSGNFWWARASYVTTLPRFIASDYYAPEFWIGQGLPRWHSFHQSGINHYQSPYPESCYR